MSEHVISQRELRNDSGKIMRGLDDGETYVITRNGVPVGELRPYRPPQFQDKDTVLAIFTGAPRIDFAAFWRDIDEYVDQNPDPRV